MNIRFHKEILPYYEAYVALEVLLGGAKHLEWKAPLLAAGLQEEAARLYDGRLELLCRVQEKAWPPKEAAAALLTSGDGSMQGLYSAELLAAEAIPHRLEQLARLLGEREEAQRQRMISERLADALDAPLPAPQDTPQLMALLEEAGLESEQKYHLLWLYHHSLEAAQALEGALAAAARALGEGLASFAPRAEQALDALKAQPDLHAYLERETGVTIPRELDIDVYPSVLLMGASFTLDESQESLRLAWGIDYLESRQLRQLAKTKTVNCGEALRVLSEKTKFEILLALREGSRYGSEVAELLGLRPATVSHHMGELLRHGLVSVKPEQNRIYYSLRPERIREVLEQAGELFGDG